MATCFSSLLAICLHLYSVDTGTPYLVTKSAELTPTQLTQNGAIVSIGIPSLVQNNGAQWQLNGGSYNGWHQRVSLDTTWGLQSTLTSQLDVTINSVFTTSTPSDLEIVISFSVDDSQYMSLMMRMDNNGNNRVYPNCDTTLPTNNNWQTGNIETLVNTNTGQTRDTKAGVDDPAPYVNMPSMTNNWPLLFTFINNPSQNTLTFQYLSQTCYFNSLTPNNGFDIFIGTEENDESFTISSWSLNYSYYATTNPTSSPTKHPTTANPTSSSPTTYNPTTSQPTFNPTHSPTDSPTLKPTAITIIPTITPTISPVNTPTFQPSTPPSSTPSDKPAEESGNVDELSTTDSINIEKDSLGKDNNSYVVFFVIGIVSVCCLSLCGIMIVYFIKRKRQKNIETAQKLGKVASMSYVQSYSPDEQNVSTDAFHGQFSNTNNIAMTSIVGSEQNHRSVIGNQSQPNQNQFTEPGSFGMNFEGTLVNLSGANNILMDDVIDDMQVNGNNSDDDLVITAGNLVTVGGGSDDMDVTESTNEDMIREGTDDDTGEMIIDDDDMIIDDLVVTNGMEQVDNITNDVEIQGNNEEVDNIVNNEDMIDDSDDMLMTGVETFGGNETVLNVHD